MYICFVKKQNKLGLDIIQDDANRQFGRLNKETENVCAYFGVAGMYLDWDHIGITNRIFQRQECSAKEIKRHKGTLKTLAEKLAFRIFLITEYFCVSMKLSNITRMAILTSSSRT